MLLTIGMIVKNEEKYLERCLNGIKPILEQIDSELIIADTGSTDRTVEIARQFTDNVFYFEWIKDFAAARNSTLEKAQGEWYMFVDADEIFESCDEIIYFFKSGEYKKYNSASYIVRNILHFEGGQRYSDFKAPRLTKILPETRFVNPIHEAINTFGFPIKVFNDYALHYGYVHKSDSEEGKAKFQRNAEPLLKRYENGERTGMLYVQLYEGFAQYEPEKADKFLAEGIEFCKKTLNNTLPVLYAEYASTLYGDAKDYEGVLKVCDDYFNMDKAIRPGPLGTDVDIVCAQALALFKLNRYDECIEKFIKFFDIFKDYHNGKLNTAESFMSTFAFARDDNFLPVLQFFTLSCINTGKYKLAADYLKKLPISKYCLVPSAVYTSVLQEMDIFDKLGYSDAAKFYHRFNDYGKEVFRDILYKKLFKEDNKLEIAKALLSLEKDDEFNAAIEIYHDFFNDVSITSDRLVDYIGKYDVNKHPSILYIVLAAKADLSMLFRHPGFKMKEAICYGYAHIKDFHRAMIQYGTQYISDEDSIPDFADFLISAMKAAITVKFRGRVFFVRSIDELFETYSSLGIEKTATAAEIVKSRKAKDYKTCIAKMREIIEENPEIAAVIAEYRKGVISEYEESQPKNEMQKLAAMIKSNIRNYISSGDFSAAEKTLEEYEKINPNDPDIQVLRDQIR